MWKEWVKNIVDNFVEKVVGKIKLKNEVDKFGSKVVLKKCMEQLDWKFGWKDRWQILCTNLMEQLKQMGVQFSWIFNFFNLKKIVAKIGLKNLLDQLGWETEWEMLKVYSVQCTVYSK